MMVYNYAHSETMGGGDDRAIQKTLDFLYPVSNFSFFGNSRDYSFFREDLSHIAAQKVVEMDNPFILFSSSYYASFWFYLLSSSIFLLVIALDFKFDWVGKLKMKAAQKSEVQEPDPGTQVSPPISEEKLEPPKIEPDIDMANAIDHVMDFLFTGETPKDYNYRNKNDLSFSREVRAACKEILKKIKKGDLISWGIRIENGIPLDDKTKRIDNGEWEYRELKPVSSYSARIDKPQTRTSKGNQHPIQLTGLKVNSNQVKQLWPEENT